jgi:hypothetical protein
MGAKITYWGPDTSRGLAAGQSQTDDTRLLTDAQADATARVQAYYTNLIAAGCVVTIGVTNYTMSIAPTAMQYYHGEALAALNAGANAVPAWNTAEFWYAIDGVTEAPIASAAVAISTWNTLRTYINSLNANLSSLTTQIAALTTNAECDAFSAAQGWPTNGTAVV